MSKYLYGASVQGIQDFIFKTNKLQEIVGASELVEQICTTIFAEQIGKKSKDDLNNDTNCLVTAAGKIQYIFNSKEECKAIFRDFPKKIATLAPGITISQAVIPLQNGTLGENSISCLENLLKQQRNKPIDPLFTGIIASKRSPRTGGVLKNNTEGNDFATDAKLAYTKEAVKSSLIKKILPKEFTKAKLPLDINKMYSKANNSYIAVIHADGNSLGGIIQQLGTNKQTTAETKSKLFRTFSQCLEESTTKASQKAFETTFSEYKDTDKEIPIRPIILGGDDLTVICEAKYARKFTVSFLKAFEEETEKLFKEKKLFDTKDDKLLKRLTACAGIAYVKFNFPFHYAIQLAEELCKEAKKQSKKDLKKGEEVPSSYAFHKVEGSHLDSYEDIQKKILKINNVSISESPYLISTNNKKTTLMGNHEKLEKRLSILYHEPKLDSKLRQWLSESYIGEDAAKMYLDRVIKVINQSAGNDEVINMLEELKNNQVEHKTTDIYDLLSISTLERDE